MAGVNGAGKSSIASAVNDPTGSVYINPDSIQRFRDLSEIDTAREVLRHVDTALDKKWHSITLETTLSGTSQLNMLQKARESGFSTAIIYVGLESPELHIERVQNRVKTGGHNIPEHIIRRRLEKSYDNLVKAAAIVDRLEIYDNTKTPLKVAEKIGNELHLAPDAPAWVIKIADRINQQQELQPVAEKKTFDEVASIAFGHAKTQSARQEMQDKITDSTAFEMDGYVDPAYHRLCLGEMKLENALIQAVFQLSDKDQAKLLQHQPGTQINKNLQNILQLKDPQTFQAWRNDRNETIALSVNDLTLQAEFYPKEASLCEGLKREYEGLQVKNLADILQRQEGLAQTSHKDVLDRENKLPQQTKDTPMANIETVTQLTTDIAQSEVLMSYARDFSVESNKVNKAKDTLAFYKKARVDLDAKATAIIEAAYKDGGKIVQEHLAGTTLKDGKTRERSASEKLATLEKMLKEPEAFGKVKDPKALEMLNTQKVVMDYRYNVSNQQKHTAELKDSMSELSDLSDRNFTMARRFGKDAQFNEFARAKTPEERLESRLVQDYLGNQQKLFEVLEKATPELRDQATKVKIPGVEQTLNAGDKVKPHAIVNDLVKAVAKAAETKTVEKKATKKMSM